MIEKKDGKLWTVEQNARGFKIGYEVIDLLLCKKTEVGQEILIIENPHFGRMLFIDGDLQIADRDAYIYNRALVHPITNVFKDLTKKRILILGGGDGGVLKDLLVHNPERVTLVDMDGEMIRIAEDYLPRICGDAFRDKRVDVQIHEAEEFLEQNVLQFDGIIYDLTAFCDKNELQAQFFNSMCVLISRALAPGGVVVFQCCSFFDEKLRVVILDSLRKYFQRVSETKKFIPSFCEEWTFALGHLLRIR